MRVVARRVGLATVVFLFVAGCERSSVEQPVNEPAATYQFPATGFPAPASWEGKVFTLSQDYPDKLVNIDDQPWVGIDFTKEPRRFLDVMKRYLLEGNREVDWVVQDNAVRRWYHAPWLHLGANGREFIRGLTRERMSLPHELDPQQSQYVQNWAVSFYNEAGGVTLGEFWRGGKPNTSAASFPVGTVAAKLLFTEAGTDQVPSLINALEWEADIHTKICDDRAGRSPKILRMLQVDVAVKVDKGIVEGATLKSDDGSTFPAPVSGWVFGTYIYRGDSAEADDSTTDPWENVIPLGLIWGNDSAAFTEDEKHRPELKETWINPNLDVSHLGWQGRLNGPVDNPRSSCMSCHSTAQTPMNDALAHSPNLKDDDLGVPPMNRWFRDIQSQEAFGSDVRAGNVAMDYSLQLAFGTIAFREYEATRKVTTPLVNCDVYQRDPNLKFAGEDTMGVELESMFNLEEKPHALSRQPLTIEIDGIEEYVITR